MAMRRTEASDEEDLRDSDNEFFSDSESSVAEKLSRDVGTDEDAVDELAAATERLKIYQDETQEATLHGHQQGQGQGEQQQGSASEPRQFLQENSGQSEAQPSRLHHDRGQEAADTAAAARSKPGDSISANGRHRSASSEASRKSASTDIDIAAKQEGSQTLSGKPAQDKSEKAVYEVPTGKFWLHDDRTAEDTNNRRASRPQRKVWDQMDDKEWKHDKFEADSDEDYHQGHLQKQRGTRGQARGRGRATRIFQTVPDYERQSRGRYSRGDSGQNVYNDSRASSSGLPGSLDGNHKQQGLSRDQRVNRGSDPRQIFPREREGHYSEPPAGYGEPPPGYAHPPPGYENARNASTARAAPQNKARPRPGTQPEEETWPQKRPSAQSKDTDAWPALPTAEPAQAPQSPAWGPSTATADLHTPPRNAPAVATAGSSDDGWGTPKATKSGWGSPATNTSPFQSPAAGNKCMPQGSAKPDAGQKNARPQEREEWGSQNVAGRRVPGPATFNEFQKREVTEYGQAARRNLEGPSSWGVPPPEAEPESWGGEAGDSRQPRKSGESQAAAPKMTPWGTPMPEAVESTPGGPKLTPWGAPIPEAEEEVEWGAEVKADEGWGQSPEIPGMPAHQTQVDAQLSKFNTRWNQNGHNFEIPTSSGRVTPSLNASAPQFVPPAMIPGQFNVQTMAEPVGNLYQPYPPYQNGTLLDNYAALQMQQGVAAPEYHAGAAAPDYYAGGVAPDYYAGQVPGPMQMPLQTGLQRPRPARRPITIEAPPDYAAGTANSSDLTGGRRYSAMAQFPQ